MLMRDIYSSATLVLAWLGDLADDSDRAMKFIATLQGEIEKYNLHNVDVFYAYEHPIEQCPSFKQNDSRDWVAFRSLLKRQWFSRVWIIQEVVLSGRKVLACGDETTQWGALSTIVNVIFKKVLSRYLLIAAETYGILKHPRGFGTLSIMVYISRGRRERAPLSLQMLLLFMRSFDATDSRDLIYGLLGIAPELDGIMILPDYRQPTEEVFTRWTSSLMAQDGKATLLHAAGLGEKRVLRNIPSWVPDLTVRSETIDPNATIFGHIADMVGFRAGGESKFTLQFHEYSSCITLRGLVIDTIANSASPRPRVGYHEEIEVQRSDQLLKVSWLKKATRGCQNSCRS